MKKFLMLLMFGLFLMTSGAQAAGSIFICGQMKIEQRLLSELHGPVCIAYKKNVKDPYSGIVSDQAWISGTDNQNHLSIEIYDYDLNTPKEYELEGVTRVGYLSLHMMPSSSIEHYAFKQNCGISLLTAKIIDRETTLLFFDNLTVLKVSPVVGFQKVQTLTTRYNPSKVYPCAGRTPSLNAYDETISMNERNQTVTYSLSSKSVTFKLE